jgi:hypothetical protein
MSNVLESALHKAVHNSEMEVLARTSEADVRAYLEELWDTVADFDILLEAGDAMGRAGIVGVEAWFREWFFQQPPDEELVLDMGGAFLMGYWPHAEHVDKAIVERLLGGLELPELGRNARDSLMCALASAHRRLSDRQLESRITAYFERIRSECDKDGFQRVVDASLRSVLGIPGEES